MDEESIYNNCMPKAAQPVVRTFNIVVQPPPPNLSGAIGPAPSPTYPQYAGPKPKMHVDSSQVRGLGTSLIILPCSQFASWVMALHFCMHRPACNHIHTPIPQIQDVMNPILGIRDAQVRAGIKPPNHAKTNICAIKEQSSLNKLRKMAQQSEETNPSRCPRPCLETLSHTHPLHQC